jgi:hypothetical protein
LYESLSIQESMEETEALKHYPVLDIKQDYYSITFLTFIEHYRERFSITNESMSIYTVNLVTVFVFQMILMVMVYYYMVKTHLGNSINADLPGHGYFLVMMHHDVVTTRLIVSFLMHMNSEPELRQALLMLKYVINHQPARGKIQKLY